MLVVIALAVVAGWDEMEDGAPAPRRAANISREAYNSEAVGVKETLRSLVMFLGVF